MLAELDKLVGFGAVRGWLNRNPVEALFADVIFGTIRWPKGIGRPSTPSLHEGFQAEHQWTRPEIRTGPEGPVTVYEVEQDAAPILVDGPVDASEYRVSFVDRFIGQPNEAIVVTLKDVDWDAAAPFEGVRQIECIGSPALPDRHATAVLPNMKTGRPIFVAFEVVIKTIVVRT